MIMRYILIALILFSHQFYSQQANFYKELGNSGAFMYTQVNKDPVIITHGNIRNENTLPNYSKGLQFMQAPGLFNSVNELYNFLTDNSKFYFEGYGEKGSYYNKSSSHIGERTSYYTDFVKVFNESVGYSNDDEALKSTVWDLIGNVRYQVIFEENYIKDSNYEFLILRTVHPFVADIDINSNIDIEKAANHFLKTSINENIKKGVRSYCLIKEKGTWKACSAKAVFKYMNEKNYLNLVKAKIKSSNFCDVLSTVENGSRKYDLK